MAKVMRHPGERINQLTEDNYRLRRELMLMRQRLSSVNVRLDIAQRQLSVKGYDLTAIPPIPMTKTVLSWINEYQVPWEALYCTECKSWFSELDNSFPYHCECCVCKCDEREMKHG
ncbi:hypothetical protein [Pantoea sp. BAV 3049]|uniref:hypothetical protein n=1 Tax=Pantoea sp. BAV 3049 TaxID=2654188 RepID=UPI00131C77BD|nr:hypothetical protein [Pantoea sp. BAV 3049]